MKSKKAQVTEVQFGHFSFEGLLLPDGSFGIAASQVMGLFSLSKVHATRDLKAICGGNFQLSKTASEINSRKVTVLTLVEFEKVIVELAFKGNSEAQNFTRFLVGLSLEQLYCDAFNIRFEKEERQAWLKERQEGKFYRRSLTDAIKYLKEQEVVIEYSHITMAVYQATQLRELYFAYKRIHNDHYFRDTLSDEQLRKVAKMEELTADYIMVDNLPYKEALIKAARYIR